jgi:hypothetical protein
MRRHPISPTLMAVGFGLALGCGSQDSTPPTDISAAGTATSSAFDFDPGDFVKVIDNRLLPLAPGTRFVYIGSEDGERLRDIMDVTRDRKTALGVSAIVVLDRLYKSGELVEKTFDYFAQDEDGNVWYMGEDTKEYENGRVVSTEGTWLAGRNGARPGVFMPAHPKLGQTVQQEFAAGVAEDRSTFIDLDATVTVPYGTFKHCVKTHDFTPLEPGALETKAYCPHIGLVRGRDIKGGTVHLSLVKIERF